MYNSKYNKESLDTLCWGMTLTEFILHKEVVNQLEDLDYARHKDTEMQQKNKR